MKTDKGGVMDLKRLARRFFGFLKEFLAEMADEIRLVWLDQRIKGLNEDLEFEKTWGFEYDWDKGRDLEVLCLAYKKVLKRVKARDEKSEKRAAQHA